MRGIALLLFLLVLGSCGTLRSPKNLIPIDSSPRGIRVFNNGKVVGITPFFHNVEGSRTHKYEYKILDKSYSKDYKCSLNWDHSLLPNSIFMVFYPFGTAIGGISLLTDTFRGGLFRCHSLLNLDSRSEIKEVINEKVKKKIILFPVFNDDPFYTNVVKDFLFERNPELKSQLIKDKSLSNELYKRGINHLKNNEPSTIKRFYLNEVANKFGATHFYYFPYNIKNGRYYFSPKLIDAFTLEQVDDPSSKEFSLIKPEKHKDPWIKTIMSIFQIIPNGFRVSQTIDPTVTFMFSDGSGEFEREGTQTTRHPKSFPKLISAIGIESVLHPQDYKIWDITGVIYPLLSASSWKSDGLGGDRDFTIWVSNYYLMLSGEVTFHTPLGGFSAGVGYGYSLSYLEDSNGGKVNEISFIRNINFSYVGFISQSFYFKLTLDIFQSQEDKVILDTYKVKSWSEGTFGIGYYFPTLRKIVRDLLKF